MERTHLTEAGMFKAIQGEVERNVAATEEWQQRLTARISHIEELLVALLAEHADSKAIRRQSTRNDHRPQQPRPRNRPFSCSDREKSARDEALHIASENDGEIRVQALALRLLATGRYVDERSAYATAYNHLDRDPLFVKSERGMFKVGPHDWAPFSCPESTKVDLTEAGRAHLALAATVEPNHACAESPPTT